MKKAQPKNRVVSLILWVLLLSIWIIVGVRVVYPTATVVIPHIFRTVGLWTEDIKIAGTGSMYPTFPKGKEESDIARAQEIVAWSKMRRFPGGIQIFGKRYFGLSIGRGDIISFENDKTKEISLSQFGQEAGFVKRVIGVPGDRVEIRDGFVLVNGKTENEPYIARARSTFGGTTLADCSELVVPVSHYFVLGDNRTGSSDSRHELGLVSEADIDHVMPTAEQTEYQALWRDTSHDEETASQPTLSASSFVSLLNEKRSQKDLPKLTMDKRLADSARRRGEAILKYNDLSFEATRSGYTMSQALKDAGYQNTTWGEAPSFGYYSADELIEYSFQSPKSAEFLLDEDFSDIGIAVVNGEINGCPTQLIVQHFAGYVPPDYSSDLISNWKEALAALREVSGGWESLKQTQTFYDAYKSQIDRINEVIALRISRIDRIVTRMEKNEWLTSEEQSFVDQDKGLYEEQDRLAREINSAD